MAHTPLAQHSLELVQITSAITTHATKMAADKEAQDKEARDKIPAVVEALAAGGYIANEPQVREKAASMLANHASALDILANTAGFRRDADAQHLGEQYGAGTNGNNGVTKKAAVRGGLDSPYCGSRNTEKRASDLEFEMRILGRPAGS